MRIRITGGKGVDNWWYKESIGEIFEVEEQSYMYWVLKTDREYWVLKEHAEIVDKTSDKKGVYESVGTKLGVLLDEKRKAYGNGATTATEMLKILYPNGVNVNQYQDMLLMVRVLDKLCRISNAKGAFNENPWIDIAGYGMLGSEE